MRGLKNFLSNKNTVTIVGVILGIIVLYVGYNARVKAAINPIDVPYAKTTISPSTKITADMVGTVQIPPSMLKGDVIQTSNKVIDKYSNADSVIPIGSLFYARSVVEKDQLPDSIILDYDEGDVLYNLPVTMESTYSNSIYPGNYIDIYIKIVYKLDDDKVTKDQDKIMLGKLLQDIKVLAVRDASGKNVFQNLDEPSVPSQIIFALPEEYYTLLKKASYLKSYEATIVPVPTDNSLKDEPGTTQLTSESLKDFINKVTIWEEKDN